MSVRHLVQHVKQPPFKVKLVRLNLKANLSMLGTYAQVNMMMTLPLDTARRAKPTAKYWQE